MDISSTSEIQPASWTRESLYALVWTEPMLKVAARFDVSSSYMARVCALLDVPRPERGYWAKMVVGKAPKKPPLPDAPPGTNSSISLNGHNIKVIGSLPKPPTKARKRKVRLKVDRPSRHVLLDGAREFFESGRLSYEGEYLKPQKRLLVDLAVSKTGLDKALAFANELFLTLEDLGHRVAFGANGVHYRRAKVEEREVPYKRQGYFQNNLWSPQRCTVVNIGSVAIGLTVIEMSEEVEARYVDGKYVREENYIPSKKGHGHTWTTTKALPSGRLRLQAYSPYERADWTCRWEETKKRDLVCQIKTIARDLERSAVEIARLVEEGERRAELERQRWEKENELRRQEEAKRRAIKAHQESREEILHIIEAWAKANHLEQFFRDAESRAAALGQEESSRLLERLKLARKMVGSIDALEHFLAWKAPDER